MRYIVEGAGGLFTSCIGMHAAAESVGERCHSPRSPDVDASSTTTPHRLNLSDWSQLSSENVFIHILMDVEMRICQRRSSKASDRVLCQISCHSVPQVQVLQWTIDQSGCTTQAKHSGYRDSEPFRYL
jgi:hypothetical protein